MNLDRATWRKSSHSAGENTACVEVAFGTASVAVRDSKNPSTGVLVLPARAWSSFRQSVRR
ncbi:DUF397 domain-containing protein [Amycolatopsis cihanbeyliensis]|uniref:Uncharacterized protein DUF397 n=1 Tax=Amycolatopsis cihanbeyliensis TaxID=1128664 RepID=A0A542DP28_AMYCI|nr:DUF397 domain-containing protein [Amycolatopsis cihanbeyliensis]TQJ04849.1 uncharacterized protein DUF397 [Amycolatopsis cihanbeyliensis]